MGRKIYNRFEILKEVAGSPGNMVYKTRDLGSGGGNQDSPAAGDIVQLLEWTPENSAFAASALKLNEARDKDEVPEVDVFSSGESLYIASPSAGAALAALAKLQSMGLFPGQWPGADSPMTQAEWENYWARLKEIPEPLAAGQIPEPPPVVEPKKEPPKTVVLVPPPPPPPKPPEPKPQERKAGRHPGWLTPLMVVVAFVLLAVLGGVVWTERNRRIAEDQRQQQLQQAKLAELERQRQEERKKAEEAQAAAERKQKELERMRQAEAEERKQKEEAEERLRQEKAERQKERDRIAAAKAEQDRKDREARFRQEQERKRIELAKAQEAQKRKEELEKRQEQERIDVEKAKAISTDFAQRQIALAAGLSNQYHQIRLVNKCDSYAIHVAIRFQSLDHTWVTKGWWQVDPHQEKSANLVYSQNPTFFFYAEGGDQVWNGQDSNNAISIEVVENPFTHILGPILGKRRRVVQAIRRDFTTGYMEHPVPFNCQK
jgi:uncharacterized membrane protein